MASEILNAEVNKIMDYFLIPDSETEKKEKILKNIDNELSFSDEFPEIPLKKSVDSLEDENKPINFSLQTKENITKPDDFVEIIEDDSGKSPNEESQDQNTQEITKKIEHLDINKNNSDENVLPSEKEDDIIATNKDVVINNSEKEEEKDADKIELLDCLLEFINTGDELNHVLSGYFSKFFLSLINRNAKAVSLKYLN